MSGAAEGPAASTPPSTTDRATGSNDGPEPTIPHGIMAQAQRAKLDNQLIVLKQSPAGGDFKPSLVPDVATRLASNADEITPCSIDSFLGNTGSGKSFILKRLLTHLGVEGHPFAIDCTELEDGYCPVSVTGNMHCFTNGKSLFMDVEGTGGTIPLMERITMGIRDRLRLMPEETRLQDKRKESVAKHFPQLTFVVSTTVVFVTREPLNCNATTEAIARFAMAGAEGSAGVHPNLIIIHNLCPLNMCRTGDVEERKFTNEYLSTWDSDQLLRKRFADILCMTFPDDNVVDKKRNLHGDAILERQIHHLALVLEEQRSKQVALRQALFCALTPRAFFRVLPSLMQQLQEGRRVSIPEILSTDMRNNPAADCEMLKGIFNDILGCIDAVHGEDLTEHKIKVQLSGLALSMCIAVKFLVNKLRNQDKVSFPDAWIEEQVVNLYEKLKHYTVSVFLVCSAEYPHLHETPGAPSPVRCKNLYIGHHRHITECSVCPTNPDTTNIIMRFVRKLFGGFQDRWEGDFIMDPQFAEALNVTFKPLVVGQALQGARLLRVEGGDGVAASTSSTVSLDAARRASRDAFRDDNIACIYRYVDTREGISPRLCRRQAVGTADQHAFCVTCFSPVAKRSQAFLLCKECYERHLGVQPSQDGAECGICYNAAKEFAFAPCGHFGVCSGCKDRMIRSCPWCRRAVSGFLKLYPV